jgi:hypothetical protein
MLILDDATLDALCQGIGATSRSALRADDRPCGEETASDHAGFRSHQLEAINHMMVLFAQFID